jgi:ribonuclease HI
MEIYFDGGCAPNPGKMSACIVVVRPDQEPESRTAFNLGDGTNNIAEWSAVVWAAQWAKENGLKKVTLLGDSLLVVNQANGAWKIKSEQLKPFLQIFKQVAEGIDIDLRHVRRDSNLAGIFLEHGKL